MGQNAALIQHPLNQNLCLAACFLVRKQPCRNNLGIVEHQQITGTQVLCQISKLLVPHTTAIRSIQHEQTTRGTLCQRVTGDQLVGQIKLEVSNTHGYTS